MIDEIFKFIKQVKEQVLGPADQIAMILGAILGIGIVFFTKKDDYLPFVTGGGTLGLVVKKAFKGLFIDHQSLSRRAKKFRLRIIDLKDEEAEALLKSLDCETQLWKDGLISDDEFRIRLKELIVRYRDYFNRRK